MTPADRLREIHAEWQTGTVRKLTLMHDALPALARVLDAADAMRTPDPCRSVTLAEHTINVHRNAQEYDAALAELAKALGGDA
jgi:hypothetical protein